MLVGLQTGHINLDYMLYTIRRGKNPSRRRYSAEKEMSEHILCECLVLEKISMQTLDFVRNGFGSNKRGKTE